MLHLYRQLQPQADTTITRHPPGCSLLTLPDGVADPGVWGSCNSPPLMKVTGQHWPLFSTPLCLKGQTFIRSKFAPLCWLLWKALEKPRRKNGGGYAVILSNLAWSELHSFLCTEGHQTKTDRVWVQVSQWRFTFPLSTCSSKLKF